MAKSNFNSNPNQRQIILHKEKTDNKEEANHYAKINLIALQNAMHTLKASTFQLWIYFAKNQDGYTFYLSKVDFLNWSNVKTSSYYNAFNELVEKGYLVSRDKENPQSTHYDFYEIPQQQEKSNIKVTVNKDVDMLFKDIFGF